MKPQPYDMDGSLFWRRGQRVYAIPGQGESITSYLGIWRACPYGRPGDLLWVREGGWLDKEEARFFVYEADRTLCKQADTGGFIEVMEAVPDEAMRRNYRRVPSIHMPRWASRLTLRIMEVRVQRLQEITEEDAKCEGAPEICDGCGNPPEDEVHWVCEEDGNPGDPEVSHRVGFRRLWDSINAKRGYSWDSNPCVWAISYEGAST